MWVSVVSSGLRPTAGSFLWGLPKMKCPRELGVNSRLPPYAVSGPACGSPQMCLEHATIASTEAA
jgi:hypothetical protein